MKKYYFIALMLLWAFTLVGCNKTEEVVVVEPIVAVEELVFELPQEPVLPPEPVEVCEEIFISAYRGDIDMDKNLLVNLSEYTTAEITAKFSDDFIDNYRYEDSDAFFFALKVYVWDHTDNGWYYDVLRTRSLSVANWDYLTGAVLANQLKEWFTWTIPLNDDIYLANSEFVEWLQFTKENLTNMAWERTTRFWAYLSSVKELKWWELADINIKVCK